LKVFNILLLVLKYMYTYVIYLLSEKQIKEERKLFSFIRMRDEYIIILYYCYTIGSCSKRGVCGGVSDFNWLWDFFQKKKYTGERQKIKNVRTNLHYVLYIIIYNMCLRKRFLIVNDNLAMSRICAIFFMYVFSQDAST